MAPANTTSLLIEITSWFLALELNMTSFSLLSYFVILSLVLRSRSRCQESASASHHTLTPLDTINCQEMPGQAHCRAHLCGTRAWCILAKGNRSEYLYIMEPLTPKARITLSDIAHRLNVSHTTVSRALRNDRQISKSLSQRIQRAAKQMGYRPDAMLSALAHYRRSSKTQPIAAGIAWINFWPEPKQLRDVHEFNLYWQGALTEAELAGYRLEEFHLSNDMPARRLERVLR